MDIIGVSEEENNLIKKAFQNKKNRYLSHVNDGIEFVYEFLMSVKGEKESIFFMSFLNQFRKHIVLSTLSAIRRHHVQAILDLRYATESCCWAAFAMAHGDLDNYANSNGNIITPTQQHTNAMYKWLETNYKPGNDSIKKFKNQLNSLSTHANIVDAGRSFTSMDIRGIRTELFDNARESHIEADLWSIANLCMGTLDLFYGVNLDHPLLVLVEDFLPRMKAFETENKKLKELYLNDPHN